MFIVFEGIDGCGKSTQVWELSRYLSSLNKYTHCLVTREPYKEREIRKILRQEENPESQKEQLTELFVKDRQEHIDELILPFLNKGITIISDRYKYATIAYQGAQGQDIQGLINLHESMPIPDFIFIIDTPTETAVERMKKDSIRETEHKFEKDKSFLEKVRNNYHKLKELLPKENIIMIDGTKSIEEISEKIKTHFIDFKNI